MIVVEVKLLDTHRRDGEIGLLLPVPPNTTRQVFEGFECDGSWDLAPAIDDSGSQWAMFAATLPPAATFRLRLHRLMADSSAASLPPLVPGETAITPDLEAAVERHLNGRHNAPDQMRAQLIAELVGEMFSYQRHRALDDEAHYSCDVKSGNCIDIHGVLLSAFRLVAIPAAYCAGYWFPEEYPHIADGMHCWVTTIIDRRAYEWDIAHHLVSKEAKIAPNVEALHGSRVLMGIGRGLTFAIGNQRVKLPHFVHPVWVSARGETREARTEVRAIE